MIKNMTIDIDKQYCKNHRYNAFYVDKIHSYAHNDSGAFLDHSYPKGGMDSKWNDC